MALTRARLAQVNTTVASLQDPITLINRGADTANIDVGFIFNRDGGSNSNVAIIWDETNDIFTTVFTNSTGGTNSNINIINYANLKVGNIFGNIGGGTAQSNVYITGALLPTANVTYDLGSNTRRFKTLWLANNTLDLGGETISTDGQGNWNFSSNGSTVSLGTSVDFNPPTISSTTGIFTTLTTTGSTILANTSGNAVVASTTQSTNTSTGALVIKGGVGVEKSLYIQNTGDVSANLGAFYAYANTKIGTNTNSNLVIQSTTAATSTTTGALVIGGGVGIAGNVVAGNISATTVSGTTASFTNLGGTLTTASQPNITTLAGVTSIGANFGDLTAQGNLTVVGNLTIQGNTLTIGSNNLTVVDSIIDLHTFANLQPLVSDDGRDIGVRFHYYKGVDAHAFLGWENDTQTLIYLQNSTETGSNVAGTAGNVKFGSLLLANTTAATSTTSGALQVLGGAGIAGALYINNTGDVSANIGAYQTYANANVVAIQANLGAYQTYANANIGAFYNYANTKIGTNTNGNLVASAGTESVSVTTGAAVVVGGIGVSGNVTATKIYTNSGVFWSANGVSALATGGTTAGASPPAVKKYGDLWYNTTTDVVYEYLNDGVGDYWIDISSQTIAANTSNVVNGDLTVSGNVTQSGIRPGYSSARPGFRVYGSGTTNNLNTSVNTYSGLTSNNWAVDYNQGSYLNNTTGFFTAPVAGLYQVNVVARNAGNASISQIATVKNSTLNTWGTAGGTVVAMLEFGGSSTMNHAGVGTIVQLSPGDTLALKVLAGTINFDGNDNWSVAYIG